MARHRDAFDVLRQFLTHAHRHAHERLEGIDAGIERLAEAAQALLGQRLQRATLAAQLQAGRDAADSASR